MRIKRFIDMGDSHLANQIAEDLFPILMKKRRDGEIINPEYFERFMVERTGDLRMVDAVMSSLVDMGFDFDVD